MLAHIRPLRATALASVLAGLAFPAPAAAQSRVVSPVNAGLSAFAVPNSIPGGVIYAQAHALDTGRPDPIPLTNSQGRRLSVPTSDVSNVVNATRLFAQLGGTTAPESLFFFGSIVGHALVTEFTY